MHTKKKFAAVVIALASITGCAANESAVEVPAVTGVFETDIVSSGKADAIILSTSEHTVVIDCGEHDDGDEVAERLEERGIDYVDCVILTHFDKDHIGGFPEVAKYMDIGEVIIPNYVGTSDEYEDMMAAIEEYGLNVTTLTQDASFVLDDCLFELDAANKSSYDGDNDYSIVVTVTHGENRFLFAGDAEETRLSELLQTIDGEYDFLKVPHHGRYNSLSEKFITAVSPQYAVITDSKKNPADDEILDILDELECETYQTVDGSIFITSDGTSITVTQDKEIES